MTKSKPVRLETSGRTGKLPHRFGELLHRLMSSAHQNLARGVFLRTACKTILEFSGCDALEVRFQEGGKSHQCKWWLEGNDGIFCETCDGSAPSAARGEEGPPLIPEHILQGLLRGDLTVAAPFLTRNGSFWTGDAARPIMLRKATGKAPESHTVLIGGDFQSLALLLFPVDGNQGGALLLGSRKRDFFVKSDMQFYEAVAETLGVALSHHHAQWALRERIKETTCLYGVANATQDPGRPLDDLFQEVVELLPPGWQYPEITSARITFDGRSIANEDYRDRPWKQTASILVDGSPRGTIEVVYASEKPAADEGPFLKEERSLIEAVAERLGVALSHRFALRELRERIKELTCLYGVTQATQDPSRSVDELLMDIVELLPPGWQFPEITEARITLDGRSFATAGFAEYPWKQSAEVIVDNVPRGIVEIVYSAEEPQEDEGPFLREERNLINAVAKTLELALAYHGAQHKLRERVKELTCLHAIGSIAQRPGISCSQLLGEIAGLLPAAFQYPEITQARISVDEDMFTTAGFQEAAERLAADIEINGRCRGSVEVFYTESRSRPGEDPFLREEYNLIHEVARQVGLILERRETDEKRGRLQEQLRHADRLATIGQMVAGAAHELNEPLGSVLGFAQLAKNSPDLPEQAGQDIDRIINAALHAREVIRKLMLFSRQMPTRKSLCNLNNLVREGLYFLESRCAREGITLTRHLDEDLPEFMADASQLHQVLVNLVVNAIQAMTRGGTLSIQTVCEKNHALLVVEDTGVGMTKEVIRQLFIPFFTTKGIGEGTGLGLSVVHGIVTAHGGTIRVDSQPGQGSRFTVSLPIREAGESSETI